MNRKGVSLPVNVLVVLAIAIVVLLGLIAFFSGTFQSSGEAMTATEKFNACCMRLRTANCPTNYDSFECTPNDNTEDYMSTVASNAGITDVAKACGCE